MYGSAIERLLLQVHDDRCRNLRVGHVYKVSSQSHEKIIVFFFFAVDEQEVEEGLA